MNKTVPTLLTTDMVKAIGLLNNTRADVGITKNKYVFASSGMGPLQTRRTYHTIAVEAGCKNPELINS